MLSQQKSRSGYLSAIYRICFPHMEQMIQMINGMLSLRFILKLTTFWGISLQGNFPGKDLRKRSWFGLVCWHLVSARTLSIMYAHTSFSNSAIIRSDIMPQVKWAVSLVITEGHFNLPQRLMCVWVNILTWSSLKVTRMGQNTINISHTFTVQRFGVHKWTDFPVVVLCCGNSFNPYSAQFLKIY